MQLSWQAALAGVLLNGCTGGGTELVLTTYDQTQDQRKIAEFYDREAARLRQMSEELSSRSGVYERLFGQDSDWVRGARLLAQSYEEEAEEHERKASKHLGLVGGRRPSAAVRPEVR